MLSHRSESKNGAQFISYQLLQVLMIEFSYQNQFLWKWSDYIIIIIIIPTLWRFHYVILILVVSLRNLTEHGWQMDYAVYTLLPFAAVVVVSEVVVDWFKHGFITKFNNIQPQVYTTYRSYLAKRILFSKSPSGFIGHTSQVGCLVISVTDIFFRWSFLNDGGGEWGKRIWLNDALFNFSNVLT